MLGRVASSSSSGGLRRCCVLSLPTTAPISASFSSITPTLPLLTPMSSLLSASTPSSSSSSSSASSSPSVRLLHTSTPAYHGRSRSGNVNVLADPTPSISVKSHDDVANGPHGRNVSKHQRVGRRKNMHESKVANRAKTFGFIEMGAHNSVTVCNAHLKYCYGRRWPYMAISAHGDKIVVDITPVAGVGTVKDDASVLKVMQGWQPILKALKPTLKGGLQVSNVESRLDEEQLKGAQIWTGDMRKDADVEISDQFTILVNKREHAREVTTALWSWFTTEFNLASPEELAVAKAEKYAARKSRWEMHLRRKLRRLIANPKAMRRVPYGALDGFVAHEEAKAAARQAKAESTSAE